MTQLLDTVLLLALPASGKSEVRHYLASLTPKQCREDFGMGPTLQLDDYPYVHFMHRIDDELMQRGQPYIFYKGPHRPFQDDFEWGTLCHLLNEDYDNLLHQRRVEVPSAAQHLFERIDRARARVELPPRLGDLPYRLRAEIAAAMEDEVSEHLAELNAIWSTNREGHTIVVELARGGPNGAAFPLTPPHGYEYSLSCFSSAMLERASILYVWVTPEESRRKNIERGKPDGQGSILHHSVPLEVMLGQYGCDDMAHLIERSGEPESVAIERLEVVGDGSNAHYALRTFRLPVGRFDNRDDLTTFVRKETSAWGADEVERIHSALGRAFSKLRQR
ncbi:MAG: hypothetical protein KC609_13130 [Myxococcales bacterium]|nr:hypothetical protein [Myxococcales bacterium]